MGYMGADGHEHEEEAVRIILPILEWVDRGYVSSSSCAGHHRRGRIVEFRACDQANGASYAAMFSAGRCPTGRSW